MDKIKRIEYLIKQLNIASDAYYGGKEEYMSNYEWDSMYDELEALEEETHVILPNSPTHIISRSKTDDLESGNNKKEEHEFAALSLAKTKKITDLQTWAGSKMVWLSWKLDGLTLVLTYDDGILSKILTRGNGVTGTNITYMKGSIKGIPEKIDYKGHLVVRGEALILYSDFEKINAYLDSEKYANPRNLASGTLALDESNISIVKERNLRFIAFTLVYLDDDKQSWGMRMDFLDTLGFITVERIPVTASLLPDVIRQWSIKVENGQVDFPVDGLVICYDDTHYAASGNVTGHHAIRAGLAFKWQDEVACTILKKIEWSCAASVITPVAIFEPVKLEGTTVSRASLCNISEIERLGIGADEKTVLRIIKANKIIPKCIGVEKAEGTFTIPNECPVCHAKTEIVFSPDKKTSTLHCTNGECPAKNVKRLERFVSRQGMDIDGLSIKTLLLLLNHGFITDFESIYSLYNKFDDICKLEGMGEKSCKNLIISIERSKNVKSVNFIYALCIPFIGLDAAKKIISAIGYSGFLKRIQSKEGFEDINSIGKEKSGAIKKWFDNSKNYQSFKALSEILNIEDIEKNISMKKCEGLTFVITGDLLSFQNRSEFIEYVELQGGKVTGSVSRRTDFLVNNDKKSMSGKNRKAKELGIPLLTEKEFIKRFGK